ncbi:hypothetical protein [Streptomyces sp. H27-H5]|uniref:hypothetical protein n=1 Tax=Streptomyces sp. H27-H5 TaxID=2996460 RepID=UPI002270F93D|nr:hypothetical protein [Streptomyces sp. H27-H5]MCY0963540.1 hypothetical protein [Streptomyces sp. H27-H5]
MANLAPTNKTPGLHVSKPSPSEPATASAVCHCGASASAKGDAQVGSLIAGWNANHGAAHTNGAKA